MESLRGGETGSGARDWRRAGAASIKGIRRQALLEERGGDIVNQIRNIYLTVIYFPVFCQILIMLYISIRKLG